MFKSHVNVPLRNDMTVVTSESGCTRNSPEPCSELSDLSAGHGYDQSDWRLCEGEKPGIGHSVTVQTFVQRLLGAGRRGRKCPPSRGRPRPTAWPRALLLSPPPLPTALCPPSRTRAGRPVATVSGARPRARVRCLPSPGGQSSVRLGAFSQGPVPAAQMSQPSFLQAQCASQGVAVRPALALGRRPAESPGSAKDGGLPAAQGTWPAASLLILQSQWIQFSSTKLSK